MTDDRRSELTAAGALGEMSPDEYAELNSLGVTQDEIYAMELAAAAVAVAATKHDALPPALRARLEAGLGGAPARANDRTASNVIRPRRDVWRWAGWLAAAACLSFAITAWLRPHSGPWSGHHDASPAEAAAELEKATDAVKIAWSPTADPAAKGAHGEVIWSNAEQRGYMRFSGLAANDPVKAQYQLWIFDAAQDEKFPVDGGVFDVGARTVNDKGEVVVPIRAKLKVAHPTLFAVTVEKPGGVVVSKRERIVVTAKVDS